MTPGISRLGRTRRRTVAAVRQRVPRAVAATTARSPRGFAAGSVGAFGVAEPSSTLALEPRHVAAVAWGRARAAAIARAAAVAWTAGGRAPGHDLLDRLGY